MSTDEKKAQSRSRSKNFADKEKARIIELLGQKKHIIESRKSDYRTTQAKEASWKSLSKELTEKKLGPERTVTQLKNYWKNAKVQAKAKYRRYHYELNKTGNKGEVPELESWVEEVRKILPDDFEKPEADGCFDCDDSDPSSDPKSPQSLESEDSTRSESENESPDPDSAPTATQAPATTNRTPKLPAAIRPKKPTAPLVPAAPAAPPRKRPGDIKEDLLESERMEFELRKELLLLQKQNERTRAENLKLKQSYYKEKIRRLQATSEPQHDQVPVNLHVPMSTSPGALHYTPAASSTTYSNFMQYGGNS